MVNTAGRRTQAFKGYLDTTHQLLTPGGQGGNNRKKKGRAPTTNARAAPRSQAQGGAKKAKAAQSKKKDRSAPGELNQQRALLNRLFRTMEFDQSPLNMQSWELLDSYVKKHLLDAEPVLLRDILRLIHKNMPKSPQKTKIRGILSMFTRNSMAMTWIRISQVMQAISETEEIITFETPKVINMERIVDTKIVLREITKPDGLLRTGIQTEKLQRLTVKSVEEAEAAAMGQPGPSRKRKSPNGAGPVRGGTPVLRRSREPAYQVSKPNGKKRANRRSDMFSVAEEGPYTSGGQQGRGEMVRPFQAMSQDRSGASVAVGEMPSLQELDDITDESKEIFMD